MATDPELNVLRILDPDTSLRANSPDKNKSKEFESSDSSGRDFDEEEVPAHDLVAEAVLELIEEARMRCKTLQAPQYRLDHHQLDTQFENIATYLRQQHANYQLSIESDPDADSTEYFEVFQDAYSCLDPLIFNLRRVSPPMNDILSNLKAVKEFSLKIRDNIEHPDAKDESALLHAQDLALTRSQSTTSMKSCYLETALAPLSLYSSSDSACDMGIFASWAMTASSYDKVPFQRRFGRIREAHLFRSKKVPFHHEYVLVLLQNSAKEESWLRLERAARRKVRAAVPIQGDSSGPLLGGVQLRESVSFATTMDALVQNSDELAVVKLYDNGLPMYLQDFCAHVNSLTTTKPIYQLFSANCRWLARRMLLTIAQWDSDMPTAPMKSSFYWKGRACTLKELSPKLKKELFGGRDIEGVQGVQLQAYSLAQLAEKLSKDGTHPRVMDMYQQSLQHLEAITISIAKSHGTTLQSAIASREDAISYDFMRLGNALPPCSFRDTLPNHFDSYATILSRFEFMEEPVTAMRASVSITRTVIADSETLGKISLTDKESLGRRLIDLGYYLQLADLPDEAFKVANEAVSIWRELYKADPVRYRDQLANLLDGQSDDLLLIHGDGVRPQVYEMAREVLKLTREAYQADPEYHFIRYMGVLSNNSSHASKLGLHQEALILSTETLNASRKRYNNTKEDEPLGRLVQKLHGHARIQQAAGHTSNARNCLREAVALERPRYLANPTPWLGKLTLANLIYDLILLLSEPPVLRHSQEALPLIEETLILRRELLARDFTVFPEQHRKASFGDLENILQQQAKVLYNLGRTEDATRSQEELIQAVRNSPVSDLTDRGRQKYLEEMEALLKVYREKVGGTSSQPVLHRGMFPYFSRYRLLGVAVPKVAALRTRNKHSVIKLVDNT